MPARSDIDLPGPDWSDGQRNMVSSLAAAKEANRVLLTLSQNMAQTNDITAAMMDEGLACFCRRRSPLRNTCCLCIGFHSVDDLDFVHAFHADAQ